ncbi:hypothetical protein MASR2M78_32740 [Treponema sp.]
MLLPILDSFLDIPQELIPKLSSLDLELLSLPLVDLGHKDRQDLGTEAPRYLEQVIEEEAGHSAALNRFEAFLENKIDTYHRDRNDPNLDDSLRDAVPLAMYQPWGWFKELKRRGSARLGM